MNMTYLRIELTRILRDPTNVFFTAILPAFFFVIFGAVTEYKDASVGNGNVGMYVMISMAAYGAVTATVSVGGMAAVERLQGWGRQLGLTPLRDSTFIAVKALVAMIVAAIPVTLVFALGYFTSARGTASAWIGSALISLAGSAVFALFGLFVGIAFRSETAVGVASGLTVVFAFLGNLFMPLSGFMLQVARFTPLYGYASLARYPVTEGYLVSNVGQAATYEAIWIPLANVAVWLTIFAALTAHFVRGGRQRQ